MRKTSVYIYSIDGTKKVNLSTSTKLGDLLHDLDYSRQGDYNQLWRSKNGSYFCGGLLHNAFDSKRPEIYRFIPMTVSDAKNWTLKHYGARKLSEFGFKDDAEEI